MVKKSTNFIPHPIGSIYDFQAREKKIKIYDFQAREVVPSRRRELFFYFCIRVRFFLCISVIPAMFYMPTELVGYLVAWELVVVRVS